VFSLDGAEAGWPSSPLDTNPAVNPPILAIITVTKADGKGLADTLASAATWRVLSFVEQIVVDGDGTGRMAAEMAGCRWLRQRNTGIGDAFNEGLAVARGEWIWFLNSGDRVHPDLDIGWLLKLLKTTKADLVTGGIHYDGETDFQPVPPLRVQWPPWQCWLAHPATIVRRSLLIGLGGFDPRLTIAMDFELWLRLLRRDPHIDVVSIPLAAFDMNGLCQRRETRRLLQREYTRVLLRHSRWLLQTWLDMGFRGLKVLFRAWRQS